MSDAQTKYLALREPLERSTAELQALLPRDLPVERVKRIAYNAIQNNPALLDCTPHSFVGCVFTAAQLGLATDSVAQDAHLIPRRVKGIQTCTLVVGYRGLMRLALNSPHVKHFDVPQIVYEGDAFEYQLGSNPFIHHQRLHKTDLPTGAYRLHNPDTPIGAYAVAHMTHGGVVCNYMSRAEIEAVRNKTQGWERGVWNDPVQYLQMWLKTVVRRLCKYLPQATHASTAAGLDELGEQGVAQPLTFPQSLDVVEQPMGLPSPDPADPNFSASAARAALSKPSSAADAESAPVDSRDTGSPGNAPLSAPPASAELEVGDSSVIVRTPDEIRAEVRAKMQRQLPPTCYKRLFEEAGFASPQEITDCMETTPLLKLEQLVEQEIIANGVRQVQVAEIMTDLGKIGTDWQQVLRNLGFEDEQALRQCDSYEKLEAIAVHVKKVLAERGTR